MGRFCLFSFIFQLPFYTLVFSEWGCFFLLVRLGRGDTKDFLSLSKKVLVTLIRFLCSFFSTARRTNKETPPQLSGLLACRYGRRRGLRNSLRSDSPRPFPSVSLVTSPPDKGGIGDCALACILTPSVLLTPPPLRATSPIFCCAKHPAMLRDTAGGECDTRFVAADVFSTPSVSLTPPSFGHLPYILLCKTPRNATGHGKGRV